MEACYNATLTQGIIKTASDAGIQFEKVVAIVSDSAAYSKKVYNDVLSIVFQNSIHIRFLVHIVNLAAEIFHHYSHTANLINMSKSSLFKKPGKKSCFMFTWVTIFLQVKNFSTHKEMYPELCMQLSEDTTGSLISVL